MVVVDASSIAKVVLQEEGWERVPLSVDAATLDYSFVEVANAVWRAVLQGRVSAEGARRKVEALKLMASALVVFRAVDYLKRWLEIALAERITVYDAVYIALAENKGAALCTCGKEQYSAARKYVRAVYLD
ncbi:MAG: type II toxin-antitoxin system VapC family toxin [Thermofilum sp.]|nr:type II toxin-antitoxin system VapC family toxin [Thermofilum sp.]